MTNTSLLPSVTKRNGRISYRCPRCSEFDLELDDTMNADIAAWRAFSQHRQICAAKSEDYAGAILADVHCS